MFKGDKKAIMGIGTLIIFIATILVAAVAAGVIISTSGILQQKALQVGDQTRSRLVNGIDVEQIFLHGDRDNEFNHTANDFEILVRPSAGSNAIQLKSVTLTVFAGDYVASASLENPYFDEVNETVLVDIEDTWQTLGVDLDGDGIDEEAIIYDGPTYDFIQFNVTSSPVFSVNTSMHVQLDGDAEVYNVRDIVIRLPNSSVYGYLHINGTDSGADTVEVVSGDAEATITGMFRGYCSHDNLIPDEYFCYKSAVGNGDTIVEFGETMFIYFRLSEPLMESTEFEVRLLPSGGRTTLVLDSIPEVIDKAKFAVFP